MCWDALDERLQLVVECILGVFWSYLCRGIGHDNGDHSVPAVEAGSQESTVDWPPAVDGVLEATGDGQSHAVQRSVVVGATPDEMVAANGLLSSLTQSDDGDAVLGELEG